MTARIDGAAVLQRRLDLGLSRNQLADMLSIRARLLARLEDGEDHLARLLTAEQFFKLADALETTPAGLLTQAAPPEPDTPGSPSSDAAALASLLASVLTALSLPAACQALGWTLDRTETALAAADAVLVTVGLTVVRRGRHLRLIGTDPAGTDTAAHITVEQARVDGMPTTTVRTLDLVHTGHLDAQNGRLGAETRRNLGLLQRAGLVDVVRDRIVTTEAFQFAFPDVSPTDAGCAAPSNPPHAESATRGHARSVPERTKKDT